MSDTPKSKPAGRRTAFIVLAVALAATAFAVWREHELVWRGQIIRWQDMVSQLTPALRPLAGQRFLVLHDQARAAMHQGDFTMENWDEFLQTSEWQQRFPGMTEIGYAQLAGDRCVVKFVASAQPPPLHPVGFDLNANPAIREAVQKSADSGYGIGSSAMLTGTNQVSVGMLTIHHKEMFPGTAAVNRTNLQGLLFFVLDQRGLFADCEPQLRDLPYTLRLLAPGETGPPKTETQRTILNAGVAGEWRYVATMKPPPARAAQAQWIVLASGIALSLLLFRLFSTQGRMRLEAEAAHEEILRREVEITTLNRGLEEKVAERTEQLNTALAREKELNRLKGNFISMVTHEIRTPLSLILGSSEILSRYLDRLAPEKRAEHLRTIDSAVQRMSGLLEDVLLFSKAEAGRMEFNPVSMDLKNFCAQLMDEQLSATNRRCPIALSVDGISGPARVDENLLRHILSNLLTNAVKYSPEGVPVQFSVARDGGDAVFEIRDSGMGIPEEDCKRLFIPFHRGKNVATIQGTGLGLVIVKHCVERHGGTIAVASIEKQSTIVTVRLPMFSPAHTDFVKRLNNETEP